MLLRETKKGGTYHTLPDKSVFEASQAMAALKVGALVVLADNGALEGIVSERDIVDKVVAVGLDPERTFVSEVMSKEVVYVTPFTNLEECEDKMKENGINHLPVVESGRVIAVVSIRDLLVSTREEEKELVRHLKDYMGIPQ
jgi:CBS domain-containing protein